MKLVTWMVAVLITSPLMAADITPIVSIKRARQGKYDAYFAAGSTPSLADKMRAKQAIAPLVVLESTDFTEHIEEVQRIGNGIAYRITYAGPDPKEKDVERAKALVCFLLHTELGINDPVVQCMEVKIPGTVTKRVILITKK